MLTEIFIYFLDPEKEGYTFLKTLTYSLVFLLAIFLIFKVLKKIKVKIDHNFLIFSHFLALPFSSIRVLEDYNIIEGILFVTPWIEGLYFLIFITLVFITRKILRDFYEKPIFIFGILLFFTFTMYIDLKNLYALAFFIPIFLFIVLIIILVRLEFFSKLLISSQIYEALVTIVNVSVFGFYEQHILSRLLIEISPLIYLFAKLFFAIILIKFLDIIKFENDFKNYIKTVFSVLGFSIGTRNLLQALAY